MSYKTTRIYDILLLERTLDFDTLIEDVLFTLELHESEHQLDGEIGCSLELVYPDLDLLDRRRGGWKRRVKRFTERVHSQFSRIDWGITSLDGELFGVLDFAEGDFPHYINTATREGKYQLKRSIELRVPLRVDFGSVLRVMEILLRMITPGHFQYCASARMTAWAMEVPNYDRTIIFDEYAAKTPWKNWLRSENLEDAEAYFSIPEVANVIVDECKGYYMNADQAQVGQRKVRRYTYDEGGKKPLEVESPENLIGLVKGMGFGAFYSSVETLDDKVGRVCIDIDSNWILRNVLDNEHVWGLQCSLTDAILHLAYTLDWPSPAVKFSGSRGMHLWWEIENDAVGKDTCEVEPYINTLLAIDQDVAKRKTTESYLSPFGSLRTLIQAMVIHAKHRFMDWSRVPLAPALIRTLGLIDPLQLIGVGKNIDQKDKKISVDIISQKKGVFRTTLSPHFRTGLVSIPIRNEFGQIGTEFRLWPYLQEAAERERVMLKASLEPDTLYPRPGMLTREHLERLAEKVRGDVTMVVKFSPSDASDLTRRVHDRYEERYSRKRKATA